MTHCNKRLGRSWLNVLALAYVLSTIAGCAQKDTNVGVTVYAASSLKSSFDFIAMQFMQINSDVQVTLSYGSSATLATSIINGAKPDIFASADPEKMGVLESMDLVNEPRFFASNTIVLAFPRENLKNITSVYDLNRKIDSVTWSRCANTAPCGARAMAGLDALQLKDSPTAIMADDAAQVALLKSGDVDAALIYASDVVASDGELACINFPESARAAVTTEYSIAVLSASSKPHQTQKWKATERFKDFVLDKNKGQVILAHYGFANPHD